MNKDWILEKLERSLLDSVKYENSTRKILEYLNEIKTGANIHYSVYQEVGKVLFVHQVERFFKAVSFYLIESDTLRYGGINNLHEQWFLQKNYQEPEKKYMVRWIKDKVIPFFELVVDKISIGTEVHFNQLIDILEVVDVTVDQIKEDRELAETWIYDTFHILETDIEHYQLLQHKYVEETKVISIDVKYSSKWPPVSHFVKDYQSVSIGNILFDKYLDRNAWKVGRLEDGIQNNIHITPSIGKSNISFDSIQTVN